jgi:uncharacterized membrane protein
MLLAVLKAVHVLAVVLWVGGMAFAHFFLRPSLAVLEPPQRVKLMHAVLGRFFAAVLWAAGLVLASGVWIIGRVAKQAVQSGGSFSMPLDWSVMSAVGLLMIAIFGHIRFVLYKRLDRAVQAGDMAGGGAVLASIRQWVGVNLALGLALVAGVLIY